VHTRGHRARLTAAAGLLAASIIAIAATGAAGTTPTDPASLPDSAFQPVIAPSLGIGETDAPAPRLGASTPEPSPDLRPLVYPWPSTEPPADRPQPNVPDSNPIVVVRPTPTPAPVARTQSGGGGRSLAGLASWYCRAGVSICHYRYPDGPGFDAYAAAGPALRQAIGSDWRGSFVTVDGIRVKLVDWCQCYKGEPHEKIIDLYYDVYARTGSKVTVRW
jgi:hypothetical protein